MIFVKPNRRSRDRCASDWRFARAIPTSRASTSRGCGCIARTSIEIASNWKIIIENFNECYHCPIAHPAFSEVIDTDKYSADISHEYYSTYHGPLIRTPRKFGELCDSVADRDDRALHPSDGDAGALRLSHRCAPYVARPSTTTSPKAPAEDQIREYKEFSDLVQREDVILCESVQRGLASGVIENGMLMQSREQGIQHFQRLVYRFLSEAPT